ncbi:hypothetical protein NCC49_001399 [Naganishia albida]|nr:hypothetical protein NCC49_001399 [Naganishia albida]
MAVDFSFGETPIRGVNAGGWLVLEPWITPSLFEDKPEWVIDEKTYGQYWRETNYTQGFDEISAHWRRWIQQSDFQNMADLGLNTVRIPIGFWSLIPLEQDEPFMTGAFNYLRSAVQWAQDVGLHVIVDLHGVPFGQNGFDNSGQAGQIGWFSNPTSIMRSVAAISVLTSEFATSKYGQTVIAIELVNEAFPKTKAEIATLEQFYRDGYQEVRQFGEQPVVLLSEAYQSLGFWSGFMPQPQYSKVALDVHIYGMFSNSLVSQGYSEHLKTYCNMGSDLLTSDWNLWTIVGEFTTAHTDCAKYLNGRGRGARFDNTLQPKDPPKIASSCDGKSGSASEFGADYITYLAQSFETQTWLYEQASGWIFWTWKAENADDWDFQSGITYGWIPQPLNAKPHG